MFTSTCVRDKHIHVYIESHHFSAVLSCTSLWNGIRGTRGVGQLGLVCVSRGDRELLELVTAQESLWWLHTLSKPEGQMELTGEH